VRAPRRAGYRLYQGFPESGRPACGRGAERHCFSAPRPRPAGTRPQRRRPSLRSGFPRCSPSRHSRATRPPTPSGAGTRLAAVACRRCSDRARSTHRLERCASRLGSATRRRQCGLAPAALRRSNHAGVARAGDLRRCWWGTGAGRSTGVGGRR